LKSVVFDKKFYPYCLVGQTIGLSEVLRGVDGREVLQTEVGTITAVLSEWDDKKVELTRENVLRHDAVVRQVLEEATPLPFRFGHLVTAHQLESYVESKSETLQSRLQHLHNCVEMSVKIIWNRAAELASQTPETEPIQKVGRGAAFLMSKQAEFQAEQSSSSDVAAIASWLKSRTSGLVRDELVVLRPAEKLVVSASFLVERPSLAEYKNRTALFSEERSDLHFLTSGPWPPYSFSNNELEFKTHLGVS